jgi:DNA primase
MFEVKGIRIPVNETEILYELRRQVELKTGRQILSKIKPSGDNIMVCCPFHNYGQERRPSCGVTTIRKNGKPSGFFHCFSCGATATLDQVVSHCFGYEDGGRFGEQWLLENFISFETYERPKLELNLSREIKPKEINYVSEQELEQYRYYHPYMFQRKLTNEIISKYCVGYQRDFRFEYEENGVVKYLPPQEVLTFPVRDEMGRCLFISRRSIYGKTFFLPKNIQKPVYGIYELPKNCKEVLICESVFNALTAVAYGRPAVALFGTGDQYQYEVLNKLPVRKYVLALDPDNAGENGIKKLKYAIRGKFLTRLVFPPTRDLNDLQYEEFVNLPEVSV